MAIASYTLAVIRKFGTVSLSSELLYMLTHDPVVIAHNKYSLWLTNLFGALKIITLIL